MDPCLQQLRQEIGRAEQPMLPCPSSHMALVHPWGWNSHLTVFLGACPCTMSWSALALSPSSLWSWFLWAWDVSGRDFVFMTSCYGWRWCFSGDNWGAVFDLVHQCLLWEFKPLSLICLGQSLGGFPLNKEPSNLINCVTMSVSPLFEDSICHREQSLGKSPLCTPKAYKTERTGPGNISAPWHASSSGTSSHWAKSPSPY